MDILFDCVNTTVVQNPFGLLYNGSATLLATQPKWTSYKAVFAKAKKPSQSR